jgi:hypothetical protein
MGGRSKEARENRFGRVRHGFTMWNIAWELWYRYLRQIDPRKEIAQGVYS